MADPVPAQVATAARSVDLGELHGVYACPANLARLFLWWSYGGIVGASGIAALTSGPGFEGNGSAVSRGVTALVGAVLTICAAAMVWRGVQIVRNRKLYLYTGGIVYTHPSGRAKWYGAWRDVQVFWGQGNTRNAESYRIVFPQGGRVRWGVMTAFRDSKLLTQGVGAQARRLNAAQTLPSVLERLRSGEVLEFGPLLIDIKGVIYREKDFAWREVTSVVLVGRIALNFLATKKRRITVQLTKIPDLDVLLRVIEVARSS